MSDAVATPVRVRTPKEVFIPAFQKAKSNLECAEALGITEQSVIQRATQLRKEGVNLKRMPRKQSTSTVDIDALNKLAADALAEAQS